MQLPKNVTYSQNFVGRAHSSIHAANHESLESLLSLCEGAGLPVLTNNSSLVASNNLQLNNIMKLINKNRKEHVVELNDSNCMIPNNKTKWHIRKICCWQQLTQPTSPTLLGSTVIAVHASRHGRNWKKKWHVPQESYSEQCSMWVFVQIPWPKQDHPFKNHNSFFSRI